MSIPSELREALIDLNNRLKATWVNELNTLKGTRELTRDNCKRIWFNLSVQYGLEMDLHDHGVLCSLWFVSADFGTIQVGYVEDITLRYVTTWVAPTAPEFTLCREKPAVQKQVKTKRPDDRGSKVLAGEPLPTKPIAPVAV